MRLMSRGSATARPFPVISISFWAVLIALVAVDLLFVVADIIAYAAKMATLIPEIPDIIKITRDRALPEVLGYLKWAVIVIALVRLAIRESWLAPARWAIVFLLVVCDDSLQLHETVGSMLAGSLPLPASLQSLSQDIAELVAFGAMGLIALALTASLFFSPDRTTRALSMRLGVIILLLGFFGVGLDFLHQVITGFSNGTFAAEFLPQVFGLLEDGGEMIVASVATAYVLTLPGIEPTAAPDRPIPG